MASGAADRAFLFEMTLLYILNSDEKPKSDRMRINLQNIKKEVMFVNFPRHLRVKFRAEDVEHLEKSKNQKRKNPRLEKSKEPYNQVTFKEVY